MQKHAKRQQHPRHPRLGILWVEKKHRMSGKERCQYHKWDGKVHHPRKVLRDVVPASLCQQLGVQCLRDLPDAAHPLGNYQCSGIVRDSYHRAGNHSIYDDIQRASARVVPSCRAASKPALSILSGRQSPSEPPNGYVRNAAGLRCRLDGLQRQQVWHRPAPAPRRTPAQARQVF